MIFSVKDFQHKTLIVFVLQAIVWYTYSMKKITIYITNKQYKRLVDEKKTNEVGISESIRRALEKYFDSLDAKGAKK